MKYVIEYKCLILVFLMAQCTPSSPPESQETRRLFQVIINVRDMDRQVKFYTNVVGMRVSYPTHLQDFSSEDFVRLESGGARLALHKAPTSSQCARISFYVEDLERERQLLLEKGIKVAEIRNPATGVFLFDFFDPENNRIHFEKHESGYPLEVFRSNSDN